MRLCERVDVECDIIKAMMNAFLSVLNLKNNATISPCLFSGIYGGHINTLEQLLCLQSTHT